MARKVTKSTKTAIKPKSYRLTDDRSGEAFLLKTGKNRKLLVFDKGQGYNRPIRHCPNESTIYIDEQSEHALVEPIIFKFGQLDVKATDQVTQDFLDAHPDNAANGGSWFEEVNEEIEAQESIEVEELILDIKEAVRKKAKEKDGIHSLEMVTSILINSLAKASKMTEGEMKRVIYREADENPYYFTDDNGNVNIFDDQTLQRRYITLKAIKDGVIRKSANNRTIVWAKDGKTIASAPTGIDLIEYFSDYLATDDGMLVLDEIMKRS